MTHLPTIMHLPLANDIQAVFFDLDGTLVTSSLDFTAIREELGYSQPIDFVKEMQRLPPQQAARIAKIIAKHEQDDARRSKAMPGAQQLIDYCRDQGWPVVVVTRNSREVAQIKLARAGLSVDRLIARDDDVPAKPDPTVFYQLFKEYALDPEYVMYLGDYIYDIQTARNARMISALIYEQQLPDFAEDADICVSELAALQEWLASNERLVAQA